MQCEEEDPRCTQWALAGTVYLGSCTVFKKKNCKCRGRSEKQSEEQSEEVAVARKKELPADLNHMICQREVKRQAKHKGQLIILGIIVNSLPI